MFSFKALFAMLPSMKTILAFLFAALSSIAHAAPAQVIIIRHGEKPAVGNELNEIGWQRARALPTFFAKFNRPVALYSGAPNKPGGSIRSIQTLMPFAEQIGMSIHTEIKKLDISSLVNAVLSTKEYDGQTVIICWEHSVIPAMVKLFGATNSPDSWADEVYDRAWILKFTSEGIHFEDIPEHVLPQDT